MRNNTGINFKNNVDNYEFTWYAHSCRRGDGRQAKKVYHARRVRNRRKGRQRKIKI